MSLLQSIKKSVLIAFALGAIATPLPAQAGFWDSCSSWISSFYKENKMATTIVGGTIAGLTIAWAIIKLIPSNYYNNDDDGEDISEEMSNMPSVYTPRKTISSQIKQIIDTLETETNTLLATIKNTSNLADSSSVRTWIDKLYFKSAQILNLKLRCENDLHQALTERYMTLLSFGTNDHAAFLNKIHTLYTSLGFRSANEGISAFLQEVHDKINKLNVKQEAITKIFLNKEAKENYDAFINYENNKNAFDKLQIRDEKIKAKLEELIAKLECKRKELLKINEKSNKQDPNLAAPATQRSVNYSKPEHFKSQGSYLEMLRSRMMAPLQNPNSQQSKNNQQYQPNVDEINLRNNANQPNVSQQAANNNPEASNAPRPENNSNNAKQNQSNTHDKPQSFNPLTIDITDSNLNDSTELQPGLRDDVNSNLSHSRVLDSDKKQ